MLSVIMAGGVGERFWPRSRRKQPKQLLDLTGRGSMIALTVDRLEGLSTAEETYVITNVDQRDAVIAALNGRVPADNIIAEPVGQNTAPCIGLAAMLTQRAHGARPMLVLPADHIVEPIDAFQALVRTGAEYVANHGSLLTFGIRPSRPETGYGYIRAGKAIEGADGLYAVDAFLEKPSLEKAEEFLSAGGYYWNSGMFMWNTATILDEIAKHLPDLSDILGRIEQRLGTETLADVLNDLYPQTPSISIDYGVMERASDVVVLEAAFDWNDVGSWEFIREVRPEDEDGNVSDGDALFVDTSGSTVVTNKRLVAVLGLEDVVVVDADDTLMVCKRDRVQDVKRIVKRLREKGRDELL